MITAVLKGAVLGLAAGIFAVVILGRMGLLSRQGKIRNILAKAWYAYVPLVLALSCASWSFVSYAHSMAANFARDVRPDVTALSVAAAESVIAHFELESASGDIKVSLVVSVAEEYIDNFFETKVLARLDEYSSAAKKLAESVRPLVSKTFAWFIEDRLTRFAAGSLSIPEQRLAEMWNADVMTALEAGFVMDIVDAQIEKRFAPFRRMVMIISFVMLLLPLAEITQARVSRGNRR